mgnify:FL=1
MKTSCECCAKGASCPLRYDEDQYSKCPILNADNEPLRYRNAEGYSDPTAFFALRNVMKPAVLRHKSKAEKKRHHRTQVIHYD